MSIKPVDVKAEDHVTYFIQVRKKKVAHKGHNYESDQLANNSRG